MLDADVEVDRREFTVRVALQVAPGERLALFGPSGAGKTTLLEVIAGLVQARLARVELGGRVLTSTSPPVLSVPSWQRRVGLLRQDPGLFPHLSVRANLCYAPSAAPTAAELSSLASLLGIEPLLSAMPARLSGGQAHRVALGRLLLAHCDTLLLDEPYTGLDASLRRGLTDLVSSLVAERAVPAILVTHELPDAQAFADRLAVIDRGKLLQVGEPNEVVLRPASRRVAELVGYLGFVPSGNGVVGVHPERVVPGAFSDRGLVMTGLVTALRPAGAGWEADLQVGDAAVTCRLPDKPAASGGELSVTVLDPPYFQPGSSAAVSAPTKDGVARPEQARRLSRRPMNWLVRGRPELAHERGFVRGASRTYAADVGQADHALDVDEVALLALLPADGAPADSTEIRGRLGWEAERYASACVRLEERGYIVAGQGQSKAVGRDLTAVPPEFRVRVPHALCDLTGVILSYPGRGGAAVPGSPGSGVWNSMGFQVQVDAHTQDVTVAVSSAEGNA